MNRISLTRYPAVFALSALYLLISLPAFTSNNEPDPGKKGNRTDTRKYLLYTEEKRTPGNSLMPVNLLFNLGFDSAQVPDAFKQTGYFKRYENIFDELANLPAAISIGGGMQKLLSDEFATTRSIPNYTLHIIGGGYDFRMLAEWYAYNNVPAPYLFSLLTCYAGHLSNEVLEDSSRNMTPHDHIADLLFFDWVGKLMFLSDDVTRFFNDTLQMRNWMGQPMFDVSKGKIYNASCNYALRPFIYKDTYRFFILMGYHTMVGFGTRVNDTDFITFSAGLAVVKGFNLKSSSLENAFSKFRPCGALFWDRNGNLLASLIVNGTENFKLRLNIYPDIFNMDHVNLGFFVGIDDYNHAAVGITVHTLLGLATTL